jgi:hypothetical protein
VDAELRDDAHARILASIAEGFDDEAAILDGVIELLSDDLDDDAAAELRAAAPAIYREAAAVHARAQAAWPAVTDCDRLDAAFDDLDRRGVVARHHWWCCQNCGHRAMPDERARAVADGRAARGYTFYHVQDTERAAEGGGLLLAYGAFDDPAAAGAIAAEVVDVLRAHGLAPSWSGSPAQRILLPMQWQRRARPVGWTER